MSEGSTSNENQLNIAIVGAGIAGLVSALTMSRAGAHVQIFEKAEELTEIGASIQLSPNATKILQTLGLEDALAKLWIEPHSVKLTDAQTLRIIAEVPISELAKNSWGAPYAVLRRADLQHVLHQAVLVDENCTLHLSSNLNFGGPNRLSNDISGKMGVKPDLIIGADGVWSSVRKVMPLTGHPKFGNYIAWRFNADLSARAHLPPEISSSRSIHVLMGSSNHTAIYPADDNGNSNVVFVTRDKNDRAETIKFNKAISRYDMHPNAVHMLQSATQLGCWPINQVTDGTWNNGRDMVLIGDAAHAMMPFSAQGAAMAIEDGYLLSKMISDSPYQISDMLQAFEKKRKTRLSKVKSRTAFNRFAYHAIGPIKWGRNLVLSRKSPQSLGRGLDWLYGWSADD